MTVNQKKEESRNNENKKTLKMITNILGKEEQIAGLGSKSICKERLTRIPIQRQKLMSLS